MSIGVSTACLYPLETEKALHALAESGVRTTEIFLNSWSELSAGFCNSLCHIRDAYHMRVASVHPFTSGIESYMLFSAYMRRFDDCRDIYRRYFETAARLGAGYVVLHGDREGNDLPAEEYCRRFLLLDEDAGRTGVRLLQENVNKYRASRPDFIRALRRLSGGRIGFVFDVKQAVRAGYDPYEVLAAMGDSALHVHISDHDEENDCLLPGRGNFNFSRFFSVLADQGKVENCMIEVYRSAFSEPAELQRTALWLEEKLHADMD